jgi:hypothetical protein
MRASTIDADYTFLKKVNKAKEEGRMEMTKLDRVMKGKACKGGRKRDVSDAAGKELPQQMDTRENEADVSVSMSDDGEGWTDDEETVEKEVERINHLPLHHLKDIISSRIPSFKFASKDG